MTADLQCGGRGVKEKSPNASNTEVVKDGVVPSVTVDSGNVAKEVVLPYVVDETVTNEYFLPLSTPVTTMAGNAPGKSSYANITGKHRGKKVIVHTLYTPGGNGTDVGKKVAYLIVANYVRNSWGKSSYARVMIELRADVEFKDNIVVVMLKITREGHYTCAGEKKTVKKPSQTSRGVPKGVEPTIEVSNSNPFDVLNSVDNDMEFGTSEVTTNLVNNRATSSGSSYINIDNDGEFACNTPVREKIDKIERQICECKLRLLDNEGNPLVLTGIVKSDSEVEVVFDETA
nr:hypothetical protein [Tanacetum cinerariifolium]